MAYDSFTLDMLIQQFGLRVVSVADAFAEAVPVMPSARLRETLAETVPLALAISPEKARYGEGTVGVYYRACTSKRLASF